MGAALRFAVEALRETVEMLSMVWSEPEPSYSGDIVHFPPVGLEPQSLPKP